MSLKTYIHALMTQKHRRAIDWPALLLLWVMSLLYGTIVRITRYLYLARLLPTYRSAKPVISIGNLTVGGAGKTPLVIAVVRALLGRQLRVAILTRGYMGALKGSFSDEARMLQEELPGVPVLIGRNRRLSIESGLKHHAIDVFVCDDAFQHWPLQRDLDIVAVTATNPFGNGQMLPRGTLREPVDGLKRAQVVVITKSEQGETSGLRSALQKINPQLLIAESKHVCSGCVDVYGQKPVDHYHLKGVSVVAFCGIADPESFRHSLHDAGFNVVNVFVFMDHHVYSEADLGLVTRYAREHDISVIMTTHKDAVKMPAFQKSWQGFKLYYLQVELEITYGKNIFLDRIISTVRR
jgi:tetraacyldisaccharide 4'-kinase